MYSIHWSTLSQITFSEEIDFIFEKSNQNEVDKFILLVENNLENLAKNPFLGIKSVNENIYSFVISKQTTIFFKISEIEERVDLILFWNNKKNPQLLHKYLSK